MYCPSLRSLTSSLLLALVATALIAVPEARSTDTFSTIYTFDPGTTGDIPYAPLTQGADGYLYGVNSTGGRSGNGTIFRLTTKGGSFDTLNTFTQTDQGNAPEGGIVQASDGNFYGTTTGGGNNGYGTLYQMVPSTGKLNLITTFASGDPGANPIGALIQGLDGYLYGTTEFGGSNSEGTVFRTDFSTASTTVLAEIGGGSDGTNPESDLIQASDGNFYGTTSEGGTDSLGTFFQVTPGGVFTVLYTFMGSTDGGTPLRGVIQGTDGAFYGIATAGGTGGAGVIFRITVSGTTGTLTPIYAFQPSSGDGTNPEGDLIQASDGNLYGTTALGGANSDGTIFRCTTSGGFSTLYSFGDNGDAGDPVTGLVQGANGVLYGTTAGETDSNGTIFSLNLGLASPAPRLIMFSPATATAGNTIAIQGKHLVGTSSVSFTGSNGNSVTASSFNVASGGYLTAVVPSGAATGPITVTANGISARTATSLTITSSATPTPTPSPTPAETATVSVIATDPVAAFLGNNDGHFSVTRTGGSDKERLTVVFMIGKKSTGRRGTDFKLLSEGVLLPAITNSVTIPAGAKSVPIKVVPITSTATSRPDKTVILRLVAGPKYKLGTPVKAEVTIAGYKSAGE